MMVTINKNGYMFLFIQEVFRILLWIGLWGTIENIVDKYFPVANYYSIRIAIFLIIFAVAAIIRYKFKLY